jgi:hypothetical protein
MLSAALVVAALCYFGAPLYIENDDPGLAMVGAGFGEAVHPEPHLIFSHYGYGLILGTLSRLVGPYAHGWFTIFAIWFSLVLVIRASLRAADLKVCLTILVVCLGCIYLATLLSAEFTTTAAVLFGAAIAEWLSSSYREPKLPYLGTAVLLVALVLSYLIRPESYLMGFIIVLPMLAVLCWRSQVKQRARLLAISLVIIAIAGFETDNLAYSNSSDWRDIPEYNDLRAQFTDYGRVPWLPQAPEYRQLGWSYNDYAMFTQWYTRNPIYSIENLRLLVTKLGVPIAPWTALNQVTSWFGFLFGSWPLLLTLSSQAVICVLLERRLKFLGILLFLGQFGAITAAALTGREPLPWVWLGASTITLLGLSALFVAVSPKAQSTFRKFGVVLTALLGAATGLLVCTDHQRESGQAAAYRGWINENRQYFAGKVTVWSTGLIWQWLITPTRIYPPFPELKVAAIDDLNCMPVETAMLAELKIDDLARELCTDPNMHLVCPKALLDTLVAYCQEHYGFRPRFKEVASWQYTSIYTLESEASVKPASK